MTLSLITALALAAMVTQPAGACADMPRNWFATVFTGQCEELILFDQDLTRECPNTVRLVGADISNPDASREFVQLNIGGAHHFRIIGQMIVNLRLERMELHVAQVSDTVVDADGESRTTSFDALGRCSFGDTMVNCLIAANGRISALTYRLTDPTVEQDYIQSTTTAAPNGPPCLPNEN